MDDVSGVPRMIHVRQHGGERDRLNMSLRL